MTDKEVVDLRWLANGEPDPHPRYVDLPREDLAGAHRLSDDELAYSLAMMSTISQEQDTAMMINSHRTGGDYISKSVLGEIAKDRIRWLSRRVAVLEGRYPGIIQGDKFVYKDEQLIESPEIVAQAKLEQHLPVLSEVIGIDKKTPRRQVESILRGNGIKLDLTKVGIVFGDILSIGYVKRWHIYIEMVRDLFKQNFYVPFNEDHFQIEGGVVTIVKSRYLPSGAQRTFRKFPPLPLPSE